MKKPTARPLISVVIPTRNRAALLADSLASLSRQSLTAFEVVVVDDGSGDDTARVCKRWAAQLTLHYVRLEPAGIAAAKNAGIFVATAPLLLFFDDDDVASTHLLAQHVETHRAHPAEHIGVLGYTEWSPVLEISEVMRHVTEVGGFLFSYGRISHGQRLDYTYFWGGRSSCKRMLLARHGIFNQSFTFGSEDIELGYRLTRFNLQIIHNRQAVQYMNRSIVFDEFCRRCERQGRSQALFSRLHASPGIQEYCQLTNVAERWAAVEPRLPAAVARVREIEAALARRPKQHRTELVAELHRLYRFAFDAFKTRGIVEGIRDAQVPAPGR